MLKTTRILAVLLAIAITQTAIAQESNSTSKAARKRAQIDGMAERTLALSLKKLIAPG